MAEILRTLQHHDANHTDDDTLRRDAKAHLARWPQLQFTAELLTKLRGQNLPWWSSSFARETWPALVRMRWLYQRADLRQNITTMLTGLPRNAARNQAADFQADLIQSVLDHGDVSDESFDAAFDSEDVVVYGPVSEIWSQFRTRMPWEDDSIVHQKLVAWVLRAVLTERSAGQAESARRPILTACELRASIDSRVWHERLPLDVRAAIDDARIKQERARPREPFQARHDLQIATPDIIAANVPLVELLPVFIAAERAMGFGTSESPRESLVVESGTYVASQTIPPLPAPRHSSLPGMPPLSSRLTA